MNYTEMATPASKSAVMFFAFVPNSQRRVYVSGCLVVSSRVSSVTSVDSQDTTHPSIRTFLQRLAGYLLGTMLPPLPPASPLLACGDIRVFRHFPSATSGRAHRRSAHGHRTPVPSPPSSSPPPLAAPPRAGGVPSATAYAGPGARIDSVFEKQRPGWFYFPTPVSSFPPPSLSRGIWLRLPKVRGSAAPTFAWQAAGSGAPVRGQTPPPSPIHGPWVGAAKWQDEDEDDAEATPPRTLALPSPHCPLPPLPPPHTGPRSQTQARGPAVLSPAGPAPACGSGYRSPAPAPYDTTPTPHPSRRAFSPRTSRVHPARRSSRTRG